MARTKPDTISLRVRPGEKAAVMLLAEDAGLPVSEFLWRALIPPMRARLAGDGERPDAQAGAPPQ